MQPRESLFLEGDVQEKYRLSQEDVAAGKPAPPYVFRLRKVTLLGNLSDEVLTGFNLDIETPSLTEAFRKDFVKVIKKHKGNIPLNIFIFDPQTRYRIQFYSKKYQVAVTSEFIQDLHKIGIDHYEVTRR